MLKIRLMRIGAKKRPFYRVVVVDERSKRSGGYVELLGTYNPLTEPKDIKLKQDRIDHWTKLGAQMSTGFLRIIGKAPQRKPRKPKKEKQPSVVSDQPSAEPVKAEEPQPEAGQSLAEKAEEKPAEQPVDEQAVQPTEETAKSSEPETNGAVESAAEEVTTEEEIEQPAEPVIANEVKQSKSDSSQASLTQDENPTQIATEPEAPRNDESKEKNEGSA